MGLGAISFDKAFSWCCIWGCFVFAGKCTSRVLDSVQQTFPTSEVAENGNKQRHLRN
jgi:hypothetical protein